MFTGLIEAIGRVSAVDEQLGACRIAIDTPLAAELGLGDSISVNGVCLTVVTQSEAGFAADVSPETLRVTTLGEWRVGRRVNLERPMRADDRLGGHFVLGHVDAVAELTTVRAEGDCYWLEFRVPHPIEACLILKGSISIDGISLTIAALTEKLCAVQIVPHTWAQTALPDLATGASVNVEGDVLGKYVARMMSLQSFEGMSRK